MKQTLPTFGTPKHPGSDAAASQASASSLLATMRRAGWEPIWVDLDFTQRLPRVQIRADRHDGLWIRADVDSLGRATLDRFHRVRNLTMASHQKGLRPLVPTIEDVFLGRQRFDGARSMMRGLCTYLADNALHATTVMEMRSAWAPLMHSPLVLSGPGPDFTAESLRA